MDDLRDLEYQLKEAERFLTEDLPNIIGIEAVNEYKENFDKEAFDGVPWKNVQRKDPQSPWYGFKYGSKTKKPSNHASRKASVKPYKARKENPTTNYNNNATQRKILHGATGDLRNSIDHSTQDMTVIIESDKEYSTIQNEGGPMKVFGKGSANMPQRKFVDSQKGCSNVSS